MKEEKNHNITPFIPLSSRLNQYSIGREPAERKRYLQKCVSPVQLKASQSDSRPPHVHVDHKLHTLGLDRIGQDVPIDYKGCIG